MSVKPLKCCRQILCVADTPRVFLPFFTFNTNIKPHNRRHDVDQLVFRRVPRYDSKGSDNVLALLTRQTDIQMSLTSIMQGSRR